MPAPSSPASRVPWGAAHDDPGGYHLVWTRDLVEAALAMIAVGQLDDAERTLAYLIGTQGLDGSWAQNYFPDGSGYWGGHQLDETAMPLLLMAKLKALGRLATFAPVESMVQRAAHFIVHNGPATDQDRWEENAGYSPFTLAMTVCALVGAAEFFDADDADYLLSLADCWNERIEEWTYADNGPLAAAHGISGYYVRMGAPTAEGGIEGKVPVRNSTAGPIAAKELIGLEFLTLVRTGLRKPDDPRIAQSVKLVDAELRVKTPTGPSYHRYNGDGYGEHEDGKAFDGTGIGRLWPLLTGERGHYEILSGGNGRPYLEAMARMTGPGGLIPEQIWDAPEIPERLLEPGRPSGSAMPLVWAHAEFLKLLATEVEGRPAELLDLVVDRYGGDIPKAETWHWRKDSAFSKMPADRDLLIEAEEPFTLHFGFGSWDDTQEWASTPLPFGMHGVRFAAGALSGSTGIVFTFHYAQRDKWEGRDFEIAIRPTPS